MQQWLPRYFFSEPYRIYINLNYLLNEASKMRLRSMFPGNPIWVVGPYTCDGVKSGLTILLIQKHFYIIMRLKIHVIYCIDITKFMSINSFYCELKYNYFNFYVINLYWVLFLNPKKVKKNFLKLSKKKPYCLIKFYWAS